MSKPTSEVKRRWNQKNYKTIQVWLPKDIVDRFKIKCKAEGRSQASVIREAVESYISQALKKEKGKNENEEENRKKDTHSGGDARKE